MKKKIAALFVFVLSSGIANAQFISPEAENRARGSIMDEQQEPVREVVMERPREPKPYKHDVQFKVAVVINDEIITAEDLNNRINALSFIMQIPLNEETIAMIKEKVTQNTIDEKIKLQEAQKEGITITEREIDDAIEGFAANAGVTSKELYKDLSDANVNIDTFREQMKSDLSWIRLVRRKAMYEIEPSQKEISRAIETAKKEAALERYRLEEIVISKKKARNLNDLVYNLKKDPRFALYAMQFSEAPSSSKGGDLGWVTKGKLFPQLENVIRKMKEGDVSDPIEVGDDYYILKLNKRYIPSRGDKMPMPDEKEVKAMIEGKRLEEFASGYLNKLRQKSIIEIKD